MGQYDPKGRSRAIQLHGSSSGRAEIWSYANYIRSVVENPPKVSLRKYLVWRQCISYLLKYAIAKPAAAYSGVVLCVCPNIRIAVFNHPSLPPSSAQNSVDSHCRIAGPFSSQHQHADLQES
jgi:hypothetical protein